MAPSSRCSGRREAGTYGSSIFLCGLIVGVMIIPIVTSISREVMARAPRDACEASLALGGTRWGMVTDVILPFSRNGIIGASLLGLARALGETMAVLLILSPSNILTPDILGPNGLGSITYLIANLFESFDKLGQSVLTEAGLLLLITTLGVNLVARVVVDRAGSQCMTDVKTILSPAYAPRWSRRPSALDRSGASRATPLMELLLAARGRRSRGVGDASAWRDCRPRSAWQSAGTSPFVVIYGIAFVATARNAEDEGPPRNGVRVERRGRRHDPAVPDHRMAARKGPSRGCVALPALPVSRRSAQSGPDDPVYTAGVGAAIVGTIEQVGLAAIFAVPLALITATFLNETRNVLSRTVQLVVDAMTGTPEIVAGLFVYLVWVQPKGTNGKSGFAASIALAVMMLPFVTRSAQEVLRIVPQALREAGTALGAPQWRIALRVVLPTARAGLVTVALLGVARAVGETAAVLFNAGGGAHQSFNWNPFHGDQLDLPLYVFAVRQRCSQNPS